MAVIRWQPWQELDTLSRQVDQLFDDLARSSRSSLLPLGQPTWTPAVELKGSPTEFVLRAELPGIDAKDLDIQISRTSVAIAGEYRSEHTANENGLLRSEFRYGKFQRIVPLPAAVENDQVKANFSDGILTLTLPRLEAVRPQVVKVNLGGTQPETAIPAATPEPVAPVNATDNSDVTVKPDEDVWAA